MAEDVRLERVEARVLAALTDTVPEARIGEVIRRGLAAVWPLVREQGVRFGHNVFVYRDVGGGNLEVSIGVEVLGAFEERGEVRLTSTPSGEAITTAHFGDYSAMQPAYERLGRWCTENGRTPSGTSWEIYGDPEEDPAKTRTDITFLLAPA
ncbi:MAG TPA: GyrI-like domain-containing protein [Candidatus Dormibacteraeota bacterium]|nr:GyrI-like domain-containing protein [Candidatus Dormibacteraeota bacterium]